MMTDRRPELPKAITAQIAALKWVKIVILGSQKCGKTSIVRAFCEQPFNPGYQPTIGVDYGFKMHTTNEEEIRVTLWDLSGSNEYMDVRTDLYDNADGVVLVCDVGDPNSFVALPNWLRELEVFYSDKRASPNALQANVGPSIRPELLIIANKTDLRSRLVTQTELKRFCDARHIPFMECSAARRDGVDAAFTGILQRIIRKSAR